MDETFVDDGLERFVAEGTPALPGGGSRIERDGAQIWYASFGDGPAVILLHGGMGSAANFGHQVPALLAAGYRVVAIDSRGQGHSSWDGTAYSYERMGEDVFAVMDTLGIARAAIIGWSDGACTGLVMARARPQRIAGLFFFACNVDASGTLPFEMSGTIGNCLSRLKADYAAMSPEPQRFDEMSAALQVMQGSQPDYSAEDLATIAVPVSVVQGERDEFIRPEHARYIAATIPGAEHIELPEVSHFAMMQRPALFNAAMLQFLARIGWQPSSASRKSGNGFPVRKRYKSKT